MEQTQVKPMYLKYSLYKGKLTMNYFLLILLCVMVFLSTTPIIEAGVVEDTIIAINDNPTMVIELVTFAVANDPVQAAAIVSAAIFILPERSADITFAAIKVAPEQAASIVSAAVGADPNSKDAIIAAAILAAPEQTTIILAAAAIPTEPEAFEEFDTSINITMDIPLDTPPTQDLMAASPI